MRWTDHAPPKIRLQAPNAQKVTRCTMLNPSHHWDRTKRCPPMHQSSHLSQMWESDPRQSQIWDAPLIFNREPNSESGIRTRAKPTEDRTRAAGRRDDWTPPQHHHDPDRRQAMHHDAQRHLDSPKLGTGSTEHHSATTRAHQGAPARHSTTSATTDAPGRRTRLDTGDPKAKAWPKRQARVPPPTHARTRGLDLEGAQLDRLEGDCMTMAVIRHCVWRWCTCIQW